MPEQQAPQNQSERSDILLESGTNELEILVFGLGDGVYGVNVAKVREVILPVKVVASPDQPPSVMGMFNLRNRVMPLVDLHHFFDIEPADPDPKNRKIIVMEFNGREAAFQVEFVEQIYRMSWADMGPLPEMHGEDDVAVTGITHIKDRLVLMLDFESVFDHISQIKAMHIEQVENTLDIDRGSCRILIAEDSSFIRNRVRTTLVNSGYTKIQIFSNGVDAWEALEASLDQPDAAFNLVITDIEMPQMDGLALTRRIKSHPKLKQLPVLLFSSLITPQTLHKGRQVGADEQISKPQLAKVISIVDRWIQAGQERNAA